MTEKPMRLAGTWSKYSNSAMPQDTSAAITHGFEPRCLRCPYQAKVMNKLDAPSRSVVIRIGWESIDMGAFPGEAPFQRARILPRSRDAARRIRLSLV